MRHIFSLMFLFVTTLSVAQQINPVPDYIFRNQMSVGRIAPTDTAAYISIGPRFGANRGIMLPMVVDTNAVIGVKRNGLLIFSVQLNNFAYWDSTTSRFRRITADAVVDSLQFATRAWRRKGDDSLAAIINQRTDTALLSTRAYRQKAVDSLITLISTLGGGTVLSVSAGTGMNFTTITTSGSVSADTSALSTRAWRRKGDDSLGAIITGKVNISDTATMLTAYLRKADTTSMLSPYLRKTDTTAMLSPYVRNAGFGLTKGTQTISVDSALMATRARVQKGIDSVASLVTTIDSMTFSTRAWRQKGVDSVAALANTKATATGTTNYLSKFTGTNSLGNSIVYATTSEVGISTPSPTHPLDVNGRVRIRTIDSTATGMNMLYADNDGVIKKASIPASGSGTVTSVSAGTGMSFTTITTTGSVSADTVALATRAWRQKGIDSVANVRVGGSGTTNRVAKFTASGTIGSSLILDNGTNVGIGTLSPTFRVDINGTLRTVNGANFATSSGSVTIGGTSTTRKLRVDVNTANDDGIELNNGTNGGLLIRTNTSYTYGGVAGNSMLLYQPTNNLSLFSDGGNITFHGGEIPAERMRLTGAGNLGIGTTSPSEALHVVGRARVTTIDSSASPINMLWADANGRIMKAAVPTGGGGGGTGTVTSVSAGIGMNFPNITTSGQVNADTSVLSTKVWRQKGVDSLQSNINLKMNIADTSTMLNPYVRSSGTNTYIPKFNADGRTLSNSAIYDSSGFIKVYSNNIGNVQGYDAQTPNPKFQIVKDGVRGFGLMVEQNDSVPNSLQLVHLMRRGLLTADTPRTGYGVGMEFNLQSNTRRWRRSGWIMNRITDSAESTFRTEMGFMLNNRGTFIYPLIIRPDSTIRVLGLAGTGTRNVVADANGDLRIGSGSGPAEVDSLVYSTRAWRQKGIDSVVSLIGGGSGSGTVTSVSAGTGMNFSTITTTGSVSADTIILSTRARTKKQIDSVAALVSGVTMSEGTVTIESGWNFSRPTGSTGPTSQVVKVTDGSLTTVFVNIAVHKTTATFTQNAWVKVGTVPSGYRPNNVIMGQLPSIVSGNQFNSQSNVTFTGDMKTSGHMAFRIQEDGDIEINVDQVTSSVDLSGANYVLFPIVVSFPIIAVIN